MFSVLALAVLVPIVVVAAAKRSIVRSVPALFLGPAFFIAAFLPVMRPFDLYVRVAAGAVSLLVLLVQVSGYSTRTLTQIRVELILLVGAIGAIVASQTAWSSDSGRTPELIVVAAALAVAFVVIGMYRAANAMAETRSNRAQRAPRTSV